MDSKSGRLLLRTALVAACLGYLAAPRCEAGGPPYAKLIDVTAVTGAKVTSRMTAWHYMIGDQYIERLAGYDANNDLIAYARPLNGSWTSQNVTQAVGRHVTSTLEAWVLGGREHLAGRGGKGELIVFSHSHLSGWQVDDVTAKTGYRIAQPVTGWRTPNGQYTVEHLAAPDASDNLVVFWRSQLSDWKAINVSTLTGVKVTSAVTSWVTGQRRGEVMVEHLAGLGIDGLLYEFTWSAAHDWQAHAINSNHSLVHSPVCDWMMLLENGEIEEKLAGVDAAGRMRLFVRRPGKGWWSVSVYRDTDRRLDVAAPAPYGFETTELLGARAPGGELILHWVDASSPAWAVGIAPGWQALNLSQLVGRRIATAPVAWRTTSGSKVIEHLGAPDDDDHLLVVEEHDRPRILTDAVQGPFAGLKTRRAPGSVLTILMDPHRNNAIVPDRQEVRDMLFGKDRSVRSYFIENSAGYFQLREAATLGWYGTTYDWEQHYTAHFTYVSVYGSAASSTYQLTISYEANGQQTETHTDTVLEGEWRGYSVATESQSQVTVQMTGSGNADLYVASGYQPTRRTWVCGPQLPGSNEACTTSTPAEPCDFINGHTEKWTDVILQADDDFDFASYDHNGDGTLDPTTELAVLIAVPQNHSDGFNRPVVLREVPGNEPLIVDGVRIGMIAEVYLGYPPEVGITAHELSHLLLGTGDMYLWFFSHTAPGAYSLMDQHLNAPHLDAFHKLKLRWLRPELVLNDGHYSLPDVEKHGSALILMDPQRGTDEYFIVENRFPGTSFDSALPSAGGLAVWHIMESPSVYGTIGAPDYVDPTDWAEVCSGDWPRRAIRMIRPVITPPFNDGVALWNGIQSGAPHELLSQDSDPTHAELRWADGTPSGFNITNLSGPGPTMTMTLDVPW